MIHTLLRKGLKGNPSLSCTLTLHNKGLERDSAPPPEEWNCSFPLLSQPHLFIQRIEEDYCLHGLPEAHFISQDGVCALSPGEPQPV